MLRAREQLGWWPSVLMAVGFVASSGDFLCPVTPAGWVVRVAVIAALARHFLQRHREHGGSG